MRQGISWIAIGMILAGCQAGANARAGSEQTGMASTTFEQQAIKLTADGTELVLSSVHEGQERKVALVIRYSDRPAAGGHCSLSIIEQAVAHPVVVESSDQVMICSGMSVSNADAVRGGLEAKVEANFIRLDEDRIRNRSEYEFVRTPDGRWHLAYSADIGPEEDPVTGELLVASYAVAYQSAMEGPLVSEVDREAVTRAREKSVY